MKSILFTFSLFISCLALSIGVAHSEIKAPNYDFSLSLLDPFLPGKKSVELLKDKSFSSEMFEDTGATKIYRFKIKKENYTLDIYAQIKKEDIVDIYVRLPQYFIHDKLLQQLRDKYQKHDRYVVKDKSALYVWLNKENSHIIYHGSCSISCFPVFLEITSNDKSVEPIYKKLNSALPKW